MVFIGSSSVGRELLAAVDVVCHAGERWVTRYAAG
jgi:hypothetical protein